MRKSTRAYSRLKRLCNILLSALLVVTTLFTTTLFTETLSKRVAAQSDNQLIIDSVDTTPGSSGTFAIQLNNQVAVSSGELHFNYDSTTGVQLANIAATDRLAGYSVLFNQDAKDPANVKVQVLFYLFGTGTIAPGQGTLVTVSYTMTADATGRTSLTFDTEKTILVGEGTNTPTISTTLVDGEITVQAATQPALANVQPADGDVGTTVNVTILGTATTFVDGTTTIDFGEGININNLTVQSPTQLKVELVIASEAEAGVRTLTVTTGGATLTKADAFTVHRTGPTPVIMQISPASGDPGAEFKVTIDAEATNFVVGRTDVDFGDGITVSDVDVVSPTQVVAEIEVDANATAGERTVTLTTGSETAYKTQGFRVNVPPSGTGAATLYVDSSPNTVNVNQTATLAIVLAPGSTPVNGVQIHGKVDPAYLRIHNVTKGSTHLGEDLDPIAFDAHTGVFSFGTGILGQTITTPFTVLILEVEALQATTRAGTPILFLSSFPATNIVGPGGSIMEAAIDGLVMITSGRSTATLAGRVDLQGRPAKPHIAWSVPVTVEMTLDGTSSPTIYLLNTNEYGEFTLENLAADTYEVRIKGAHTLANRVSNVTLTAGENTLFFGTLYEGDIESETSGNQVVISDFGLLSGSFDKCAGDAAYQAAADLNETDGCITVEDFGLFSGNFNKQGDIAFDSPTRIGAPLPLSAAKAILAFDQSHVTVNVGEIMPLGLYVDPRDGDAITAVTAEYQFDPALVEVVKVVLTGNLPTQLLAAPVIDNSQGVVKLSASAGFGNTVNERVQIATIHVKLKQATTSTTLAPVLGGPRNTNIASTNGSILAEAQGIILSNEAAHTLFLPVITR